MPRTKKSASAETKPAASEAVQARNEKKTEEVYLQIGGQEWNISDCRESAAAAYIAECHNEAGIKKLVVYLKPDEGKAYYVVNDSDNGSIAL